MVSRACGNRFLFISIWTVLSFSYFKDENSTPAGVYKINFDVSRRSRRPPKRFRHRNEQFNYSEYIARTIFAGQQ